MSERRGKKMGVFNVRAANSTQPLADVEYKFDSKKGVFFASYSDEEFENASREELRTVIEACVRAHTTIEYAPWINVKLPAEYRVSYRSSRSSEIRLDYDVIFISKQSFEHGVRAEKYRLTRPARIDEATGAAEITNPSGSDGRRWSMDDKPWDVLLPYTPDRLEALKSIQDAITRTRERLLALVGDAQQLDQVTINGEARIGLIGAVYKEKS